MKKGFTLIELVISLGILMVLVSASLLAIHPDEAKAKAKDQKIISDMMKFDQKINDYKIDNDVYPDLTPPPGITYVHQDTRYEIDVTLEYYIDKSQNDGGNNPNVYEIGNDLTVI